MVVTASYLAATTAVTCCSLYKLKHKQYFKQNLLETADALYITSCSYIITRKTGTRSLYLLFVRCKISFLSKKYYMSIHAKKNPNKQQIKLMIRSCSYDNKEKQDMVTLASIRTVEDNLSFAEIQYICSFKQTKSRKATAKALNKILLIR